MDDGAETHVGRTIGLAGAAAGAVIEMGLQARIGRELPRVERGDQRDAPPWRFVFVHRDLVGRAVLGAHAAHHAAVEFVGERHNFRIKGKWQIRRVKSKEKRTKRKVKLPL